MKRRLAHDNRKDGILSPLRKKFHKLDNEEEEEEVVNRQVGLDEQEEEILDFEPTKFLRCHSRNRNDAADVGTQVWQCAFEPDNDNFKKRKLVATCGGNSLCLIDVLTEEVYMKYYSNDIREMFYSLSWTTLAGSGSSLDSNILAVGGALSVIHLIYPDTNKLFLTHKVSKKSGLKEHIVSLLFDKNQPHILFCAMNNAQIMMFDIGCPRPPHYVKTITMLHVLDAGSELFALTQLPDLNLLLAGGNEGLYGWKLPTELAKGMKRPSLLKFKFPPTADTKLVDSLEVIKGTVIATKCALHGVIYVWDVAVAMEAGEKNVFDVAPLYVLQWSDTDNYFMNMGYNAGLLACGDDKGMLWVYNLNLLDKKQTKPVEPSALLQWPEVEDQYIALKRKLRLDVYDIVVDKVAVDSQGQYLVAVTANNMVCIWKRIKT